MASLSPHSSELGVDQKQKNKVFEEHIDKPLWLGRITQRGRGESNQKGHQGSIGVRDKWVLAKMGSIFSPKILLFESPAFKPRPPLQNLVPALMNSALMVADFLLVLGIVSIMGTNLVFVIFKLLVPSGHRPGIRNLPLLSVCVSGFGVLLSRWTVAPEAGDPPGRETTPCNVKSWHMQASQLAFTWPMGQLRSQSVKEERLSECLA